MINADTHQRFWVTLDKATYTLLSEKASDNNLSVSAFAGQIISNYLGEGLHSTQPTELSLKINEGLKHVPTNQEFTVKDLFSEEDWGQMNRSMKGIAAKILAKIERESEVICKSGEWNKTSLYLKKSEIKEDI